MALNRIESVPLYQMVRERLISQIEDGTWKPGAALPSEFQLGDLLGVSQGTVRKALNDLESLGVVERKQGRGTYVKTDTPERSMFHFFRLSTPDGQRIAPETLQSRISDRPATEAEQLSFETETPLIVTEIKRQRRYDNRPLAQEIVILRSDLFPGVVAQTELPNALYPFYQQEFHISILRAEEKLCAIAANKGQAKALEVAPGAPLLKVERRARDIRDRPVELRQSVFVTTDLTYDVELS